MNKLYERTTRYFLNILDPYDLSDSVPTQDLWVFLKSHLYAMRRVMVFSVLVTILAASVEVWLIRYAGQIIDMLDTSTPATIWALEGRGLLMAAIAVLLLRPIAQFLRMAVNDISFQCNVATLVRWRAYDHLIKQSVGWFQDDLAGRTANRVVSVGNHVSDSIHSALNALAFGIVYMIGVVIMMAGIDVWLAAPLFVWLALYIGVLVFVIPRVVDAHHVFNASKNALLGSVVDTFTNFDTVKLFAPPENIRKEQLNCLEDTRQTLFVTRQLSVGLRTTLVTLEAIVMIGFIGYGIWLWSTEAATIGVVSAAIALSLRITTMADWILDSVWWVFMRIGYLRESLVSIGQPIVIPQKPNAPDIDVRAGAMEITDLQHHYGTGRGGLAGLNLSIKPGEKVGIVGRSGAGKSTLVNLILRFFEAESGTVAIDGQDIRDVDQDSLRSAIGMVAQQAALLNRSVRDNILLGRDDVSDEQMFAAAREARAHDFILNLKDKKGRTGYDAHVGERGVKLSGGQRQRVALARVILKDAPILILDEATSALDSEVEAEIQAALIGVMENKTVIAVAHRLSTIARMDRIVVLDAGEVVEEGTHSDLIESKGLYAGFWERQSQGFIDTDD